MKFNFLKFSNSVYSILLYTFVTFILLKIFKKQIKKFSPLPHFSYNYTSLKSILFNKSFLLGQNFFQTCIIIIHLKNKTINFLRIKNSKSKLLPIIFIKNI